MLAKFQAPETGRSVTRLQQIHRPELDGEKLPVSLELTTWAPRVRSEAREELAELLRTEFPKPPAAARYHGRRFV